MKELESSKESKLESRSRVEHYEFPSECYLPCRDSLNIGLDRWELIA